MANECRVDGCEKPPPYVRELCQMHYTRWKRGVDMGKQEERRGLCLSERLWQYVDAQGTEDCWEWSGRRTDFGYGQFVLYPPDVAEKRCVQAHRMAYESFWRVGLVNHCLHRCNNPSCCNPLHLYDGTTSDNARDSVAAGTNRFLRPHLQARGEQQGRAKLTDDTVREIRQRYATGSTTQQKLADEYGVDQTQISNVVRRKTWRHVE